jgi:hypothetical protein
MFKIHSFFPFANWFMSFLGMFFAAGDTGLGGFSAGNVLDALDLGDGGEEAGGGEENAELEDDGGGEGAGEGDGAHAAGAEGDETELEGSEHNPNDKPRMHADVTKHLDELKAKNPALYKRVRGIVISEMNMRKDLFKLKQDFPNGVNDVLKLKGAIDKNLGGVNGLKTLGEEIKFYHDLDAKWEAKDPALVKNLAEQYPEEFSAMVPHFVNTFAEKSPEGYTKFYAGMVIAELQEQKVPQALYIEREHLQTLLEMVDDPRAKSIVQKLLGINKNFNDWTTSLDTMAAAKIPDKNKSGNDPDAAKNLQHQQREMAQFNREVSFSYNTYRDGLINQQLDAILKAKSKTISPERREIVVNIALKNLSKKMHAAGDFRDTIAAYSKAKDGDGLVRFLKSRVAAALKGENGKAGIVDSAYRILTGDTKFAGGGKNGDKGDKGGAKNTNPGQGWIKMDKPPAASEISRRLTEAEGRKIGLDYEQMILKGRRVLKDGRKVYTVEA